MISISDRDDYKNICKKAIYDENVFNSFKSEEAYRSILEHVSYEQGLDYFKKIKSSFPEYINYINDFKQNDLFGGTKKYAYDNIGEVSPTTLRYIKVLSDLKKLFGDLNGKNIIEIGVGYGGQCFVLNKYYNIKKYNLIDLPEVQGLSFKYLERLNVNTHKIINVSELKNLNEEYDIVISNYAYSELDTELQDYYYDHIIKKSKMGYFTFNFVSDLFGIKSYNKQEIIEKFKDKNISIIEELPLTFNNNCIIYFK
jgi:hypothetical protein